MKTFDEILRTDPFVSKAYQMGLSYEQIIEMMYERHQKLMAQVIDLMNITPTKHRLPDGTVIIWRCPDHLIPETKYV